MKPFPTGPFSGVECSGLELAIRHHFRWDASGSSKRFLYAIIRLIVHLPKLNPIYSFGGLASTDRTRSGLSGFLGPFLALLGPASSCGEAAKVLDCAGESSTFSVTGFGSQRRFNSLRLHHNSVGNSGLFSDPRWMRPAPTPGWTTNRGSGHGRGLETGCHFATHPWM